MLSGLQNPDEAKEAMKAAEEFRASERKPTHPDLD